MLMQELGSCFCPPVCSIPDNSQVDLKVYIKHLACCEAVNGADEFNIGTGCCHKNGLSILLYVDMCLANRCLLRKLQAFAKLRVKLVMMPLAKNNSIRILFPGGVPQTVA